MNNKDKCNKDKCNIEKCNRKVKIFKHGLCASHVAQLYRHGHVPNHAVRPKRVFNKYFEGKKK